MAELALVVPASRCESTRPPIGLMYLATYAEKNGISTEIIDVKEPYHEKKIPDKIISRLRKSGAKYVGLTTHTPEVDETAALAKRIKKELGKNITTIVGGVHVTLMPQDLLIGKGIDYGIMGEGEEALPNLIRAIKGGKGVGKVNGIAFAKGKKIIKTRPAALLDLEKLLPLDYGKVDMEFYTRPNLYVVRGVPLSGLSLFTSRGCCFRCRFCSNPALFGSRVRYRKPEHVADELEMLKERYKIDGFFFFDDTFTTNRKHVLGICDELIKRKLGMVWGCQTRANLIDRETLLKMKEAGCVQMEFGVESGSDRMLKHLNKGITKADVREAFRLCREVGMRRFANFMINLPGETEDDLQQSIALAQEIKAEVTIFNITTPYPGSELFSEVSIKPGEYSNFNNVNYREQINYLQEHYHLAEYDRNLNDLEKMLNEKFPSIHNLKINSKTAGVLAANLGFLFTPRYLKLLLKSGRKRDYLSWGLGVGKMLKSMKRA